MEKIKDGAFHIQQQRPTDQLTSPPVWAEQRGELVEGAALQLALVVFPPSKVSPSPSSIFDFVFMQSPHTPARSLVHRRTHPFINRMGKMTLMMSGYRNVTPPAAPPLPPLHRPIYIEMMKVVLIKAVISLLIYKLQTPPAKPFRGDDGTRFIKALLTFWQ